MKTENNKIVEATENEIYSLYLDRGYDDVMPFNEYLQRMKSAGTKIVEG